MFPVVVCSFTLWPIVEDERLALVLAKRLGGGTPDEYIGMAKEFVPTLRADQRSTDEQALKLFSAHYGRLEYEANRTNIAIIRCHNYNYYSYYNDYYSHPSSSLFVDPPRLDPLPPLGVRTQSNSSYSLRDDVEPVTPADPVLEFVPLNLSWVPGLSLISFEELKKVSQAFEEFPQF